MSSALLKFSEIHAGPAGSEHHLSVNEVDLATDVLGDLASVFFQNSSGAALNLYATPGPEGERSNADRESHAAREARYSALVDQVPALIFMAYLDRGIGEAYISPQIEATLGFTQQEWLEDPVRWYHQIHPDDKARWSVEAANMFLTGEPLKSVYRVMSRDNRVVWFQCEAKMIRQENGRPWFIHGVGFDISEMKEAENALHRERDVLSSILDTVGALVVMLDRDGRILRINRACERMTRCSSSEAIGKRIWDLFVATDESSNFVALFQEMRRDRARTEFEGCWFTRDGEKRTIAWSTAVHKEDKRIPDYIIASGIDVTERKRAEELRSRLAAIVESAADAIIGMDLNGAIVTWNPAAERLFGYRTEEVIGESINLLVPNSLEDEFLTVLQRLREGHTVKAYESVRCRKDGSLVSVRLTTSPIRDSRGTVIGASKIVHDISDRKRAEEQILSSLREKDVLLKEIHHRVKNNLAVISSLFYLESKQTRDDPVIKILQESQGRVRSMALVHEMLYQSGNFAEVDFAAYVGSLASQLLDTYNASKENIRLKLDLESVKLPLDLAVPCGLVLNEAMTNALKHAFRAGRNGEISLNLKRTEGNKVVLSVADNGVGVPENLKIESLSSLGLRLIASLARQIDGCFELVPAHPGTEARLVIPMEPHAANH
jgi:PAS domain S-box-containing protein